MARTDAKEQEAHVLQKDSILPGITTSTPSGNLGGGKEDKKSNESEDSK